MGTLLMFSPKVPRPLPARVERGPAKIILFTGVRYERGPVTDGDSPARKLGRRRKG